MNPPSFSKSSHAAGPCPPSSSAFLPIFRNRLGSGWQSLLLFLLTTLLTPMLLAAEVTTDKSDYPPGSTVQITGTGFQAGESVQCEVDHADDLDTGAGHDPWLVTADGSGSFTTTWFVDPDDNIGATLILTATGQTSGNVATATFTDAPPVIITPPSGTAPVNPPAGGLGIDGNLLANNPTTGIGDWVKLEGSGTGGGVLDPVTGNPLNAATTFHLIDPFNSSDDIIFTGTGDKFNDAPTTWNLGKQSAPDKNDIENAVIHFTTDANGQTWVIVSADRYSNNGDSYIDVEFFQKSVTVDPTTLAFSSGGIQAGRTLNDFSLSFSFVGGGSNPEFTVWQWKTSGTSYDYFDVTSNIINQTPAEVYGAVSATDGVSVPYTVFGGETTYKANQFAEVAVNLTALVSRGCLITF
ncbi:MAG: hypothetical protein V4675_05175 [Verrucomicrobiota bacterium]